MNKALIEQLENIISSSIEEFTKQISDKYGIDQKELISLWENRESTKSSVIKPVEKKVVPKKPSPKTSTRKSSSCSNDSECEGCPYVYTKGAREGEICNSKPKNGAVYCSRHKKYEGIEPKQKKVLPTTKKSVSSIIKPKKTSGGVKNVETVLRKHKVLGQLWHPETGMVFKSPTDRTVIGKCVDDKLNSLTKKDIDVCMARNFKFDSSQNSKEEVEEVEDEEDLMKEEEVVEEEVVEDEEDMVEKKVIEIAHKITDVSSSNNMKSKKATCVKKSINKAIAATKIQAKDVEQILGELQVPYKPSKDLDEEEEELEELEEEELEEELDEELEEEY